MKIMKKTNDNEANSSSTSWSKELSETRKGWSALTIRCGFSLYVSDIICLRVMPDFGRKDCCAVRRSIIWIKSNHCPVAQMVENSEIDVAVSLIQPQLMNEYFKITFTRVFSAFNLIRPNFLAIKIVNFTTWQGYNTYFFFAKLFFEDSTAFFLLRRTIQTIWTRRKIDQHFNKAVSKCLQSI